MKDVVPLKSTGNVEHNGFFDNPKLGLPSTSGMMVLFSSQTGMLEALLLDNGYLTDIRTAAAGAVVSSTVVCASWHAEWRNAGR